MRLVLVALVLSACGGGGRCENPPCQIPQSSCDSDEDCFESELCDFTNNTCGATANDVGHCTRRPTGCTGQINFTCGCDGQTYSNECVAAAAGVDVSSVGGCSSPPNAFGCGARFCDRSTQICVETMFGPQTTDFHCEGFPMQCTSNRTCNCIDPSRFQNCRETDGGFTITQEVVADPAEDATSSAAAPSASTPASR
jgi:Kazal-type serine protease inhibitor domain